MNAKGPREERETVITFNEAGDTASIWTASEAVYRQLVKRGYQPFEDGDRHARFEVAKREVKLPRPKRKLSETERERLRNRGFSARSPQDSVAGRPQLPKDWTLNWT